MRTDLVVLVQCLICHGRSILDDQALAERGIKSDAPVAAFERWLRCNKCGTYNVTVNRVPQSESTARRLPIVRPHSA